MGGQGVIEEPQINIPVKATNFILSFLVVLTAFAAGRYVFPTSLAPAAAAEEVTVKSTDTPFGNRGSNAEQNSTSVKDALA